MLTRENIVFFFPRFDVTAGAEYDGETISFILGHHYFLSIKPKSTAILFCL
jgi:hypothetical protein